MKLLAQHRGEWRREKSSKHQAHDDGPGVCFHQQGKNRGACQGEKKLCEIDRPDSCPGSLPELTSVDVTTGPSHPLQPHRRIHQTMRVFPHVLARCCAGAGAGTPY